jgi:hypothetical protein
MGDLEALLTRLEVNSKGELFAGFRDMGGIHFPGWKNLFVSEILGRNSEHPEFEDDDGDDEWSYYDKTDELQAQINANPNLRGYKTRMKDKYWKIFQLFCPASLKEELPGEFVRGHYTQQARWRLSNPGNYISLDEQTLLALKDGREIQETLEAIRRTIAFGRETPHATRTFNDLDALFDSYNGANADEILGRRQEYASLRDLGSEVFEMRKKAHDKLLAANSSLKGVRLRYFAPEGKREHDFKIEQGSWAYLEKGRMMTAQELLAKKWLFMDIEIPFFRRANPKITWVGATYCHNGAEIPEIHTVHDLGVDEVDRFRIHRYKDETELISGLRDSVNTQNPDVVSTYNTRFDLIKLRESAAGFDIGSEQTPPLFKVTTKFFERIGVNDRLVLDFLRWQKIARAYDINAKLEMAAGFRKPITYNDMEILEDKAFQGDREAARKIGGYLAGDVRHLASLFYSDEFRKDLEDICWMCSEFNLSLERVMHSPNCINDVQERGHFTELGIYREEVPPHEKTKTMNALRQGARETFRKTTSKLITQPPRKGLFSDVYKVYVPTGEFIRELVARRFPDVNKLAARKKQFAGDSKRQFFLEQYQKEFGRWLTEDYGLYLREVGAFDRMMKEVSKGEFEEVYHRFREHLKANFPDSLRRLNEAKLPIRDVAGHSLPDIDEFLANYGLAHKDFQKMANQRSLIKRKGRHVIGNYDVFPSTRFFNPGKHRKFSDIFVMDETLERRFEEVNDFLKREGLTLVAKEGNYLYLTGDEGAVEYEGAPFILVDKIPRLYNADCPYYEKFGFYSHLKLKDDPGYHMNVFEMGVYGQMLQHLLHGENDGARKVYSDSLEALASGNVPMQDLVFFNKSGERYTAFVEGSDGPMYFAQACPEDGQLQEDSEKHLQYFTAALRNKPINVYLADPKAFKPDIAKYAERLAKRSKAILKPVGGLAENRQMELF